MSRFYEKQRHSIAKLNFGFL